MELYPHNQVTYNKVFMMLVEKKICALIQGTGTGKTFILMKLLETLFEGLDVLVVVPKESIMEGFLLYDEWDYSNVRFTTYSSLKNEKDSPDVLVIDELHRAGAPSYFDEVHRVAMNAKYFFGMTATQKRYLDGNRDMAEELFGECVVYGPSYEEAIQLGILEGYDYYAILSEPEEYIEKFNRIGLSSEMKLKVRSLRLDEYQLSARVRCHIDEEHKKWVVFYPSTEAIEQAELEIWTWFDGLNVNIYKVYSKQTKRENRRNIKEFNSDTGYCVILSVDMLNEGVHLSGVRGVIFARKTVSGNIFAQQKGRGSSTKKGARIVYLDLVRNFDNVRIMSERVAGARARVVAAGNKNTSDVGDTQVLICYDEVLLELEDILARVEGRWSDYDDDIIKTFYPIEGIDCSIRLPYYTRKQVAKRARILGVTKNRPWTDTEDFILKIYYNSEKETIWKRLPSRSMSAIQARARNLGIIVPWSGDEDLVLVKYYETSTIGELLTLLVGRSEDEVEERARKLGLHREVGFV